MGLVDSLKNFIKSSTDITVRQNYDDDDESKTRLGAGIAIDQSVQDSSAAAKAKYVHPEYNPQTRKAFYDNGKAHKAAIDKAFESCNPVRDPYTGAELVQKQRDAKMQFGSDWQNHAAEADHIDPLSRFMERNKNNPFLTTEDYNDIGNRDDNIQVLSRKLNQTSKKIGKGGSTQGEWADDSTRMQGVAENIETGESIDSVTKRIRDTGSVAEKRNDVRARKRAFSNAVGTAHEAGLAGAQNAGVTAATMSGILNIVAVIQGEKDCDQAIADTVKDGGKAAVTGYAMGSGLTVLSQSLSNSSSEFIQGLVELNVPGKVITAVIVTGDTLKKWGEGEITTQECLIELGDKGLNMATMGYSMAIGQALIPIPIVGGAVGALVGSMLTSTYYRNLINTLQTRELEHQERLRIIAECEEAKRQAQVFREQLEEYLEAYFADYRQCFDDALSSMRLAYASGDADGVIAGANDITRKLGGTVQYNNVSEYKKFLDSGATFKL